MQSAPPASPPFTGPLLLLVPASLLLVWRLPLATPGLASGALPSDSSSGTPGANATVTLPLCSEVQRLPSGAQWAQRGVAHPFRPAGCQYHHWDLASARACLRGRHLYVIGNSVARDFYYQALSGLCQLPRDTRAELGCKRSGGACSERCANISFTYLFSNSLGPPQAGYRFHDPDACPLTVEECTRNLLADSAVGDALVFLLGMSLAWEFKHLTAENTSASTAPGPGLGQPLPAERLAFAGLVAEAGLAWRGMVQRHWRGSQRHVFRLRLPPLSLGNTSFDHGLDRVFLHTTAGLLGAVNEGLDSAFEGTQWGTIDQWGVNAALSEDAGGNRAHYRDFIHYNDEPHDAALDIALEALCSRQ